MLLPLQRDKRGYKNGPHAEANSPIMNFKKGPEKIRADPGRAHCRKRAIETLATYVIRFFADLDLDRFPGCSVHLVPLPASRPRGDEGHDDRIDALRLIVAFSLPIVFFTPLLDTDRNLSAAHHGEIPREEHILRRAAPGRGGGAGGRRPDR